MRLIVTLPLLCLFCVAVAGCQPGSCPELVAYREGLHKLDSALYEQHKTLIDEAVAKGIRTPLDRQVVDAEIKQAESHYQTSKAGDNAAPAAIPPN